MPSPLSLAISPWGRCVREYILQVGPKVLHSLQLLAQGWPGFPKPVFNWSFTVIMTNAMSLTVAHNITQSSHSLILLVPLVPGGGFENEFKGEVNMS